MESKLKSLKVVDLKDILAKAEVAIQGKANKPDLIAKILASSEALKVYEQQYGSANPTNASETHVPVSTKPASTAQVRDVQTTTDAIFTLPPKASAEQTHTQAEPSSETETISTSEPAQPVASTSAPAPSSPPKTSAAVAAPAGEDEEFKKRKARAERFGIPLVEPSKPKEPKPTQSKKPARTPASSEDATLLEKRAKRFGITNKATASTTPESQPNKGSKSKGNKRPAPATETVDAEELERRRKRAERFGTGKPAAAVKA